MSAHGPTPGRLVVFGSYDASLHPRVAVLAEGLAEHGWAVTQVNAPLGASTADKVASAGSPVAALSLAGRQLDSWRRLVARRFGTGHPDAVLVGYLGHADVHLAKALFPRSVIVLDHLTGLAETVRDRGLGGAGKVRTLAGVDRAALAAADVVVVDTALQAAQLPETVRRRTVVVPVGAQAQWRRAAERAERQRRQPGSRLRVVFFGLYTPLQGAVTIGEAISAVADDPIDFTMIGDGQQRAPAQAAAGANPAVTWLDWVDAAELPDVVAQHDVCLGIFGTGPKAARVIPTKVYQGMAAGCAVVTADTPACKDVRDAVVTVPPGDARALADELRRLAGDEEALSVARLHAKRGAARRTPKAVTAELSATMSGAVAAAEAGPLPPLTMNAWHRWDLIARELDRHQPHSVLEVGPGEGAAACRLAVGRSYTGIELSERTRQITAERLAARGTPGRLLGGFDELDPSEQFDLVCAFEVIEHIDDDVTALRTWAARVRPGGLLLVSTPYGPERYGAADVIAGHFRRYDDGQLAQMARDAGLVDVRVDHVGYPVGYALEKVRNVVAARRLSAAGIDLDHRPDPSQVTSHTERSSSFLQPPAWSGTLTRIASAPGRWAQRRRPDRGPGLLLVATGAQALGEPEGA